MITGILGSASRDSLTRIALLDIGRQVTNLGMNFDLIDLRDEFREMHDVSDYYSPSKTGQTMALRRRITASDCVILATPVYHGGYSGLIKNALDHLSSDAFRNRAVGIMAAGGGPMGVSVACDQLRTVVRALKGGAAPTHVALTANDVLHDTPSPELSTRMQSMVLELLSFKQLINDQRVLIND